MLYEYRTATLVRARMNKQFHKNIYPIVDRYGSLSIAVPLSELCTPVYTLFHRFSAIRTAVAPSLSLDQLRQLELPTLAYRRNRGDMIVTYKLLNDEQVTLQLDIWIP